MLFLMLLVVMLLTLCLGVASTVAGSAAVVVVSIAFVVADAVAFDAEVNAAKFEIIAFCYWYCRFRSSVVGE